MKQISRRDYLLKLVVEQFIRTAQPVASQSLIEIYNLEYSSATIRNEMNALEKDGLLEKTHTSSGRIPSTAGYQYYVDNLRNRNIDKEIKHQLQSILDEKMATVEQMINKTGEILSSMTNLVSVILGPKTDSEHLISLQLVPLSATSLTAIFVTDKGFVENKTFILEDDVSIDDLLRCMKIVEERLKGTRVGELVQKMEGLKPLIIDHIIEHEVVYRALIEAFSKFQNERLSYYGEEHLFALEQFKKNPKEIKETLENEIETESSDDIVIDIGQNIEDVTIVKAQVRDKDQIAGTIALVGPKNMDYEKAINSLEYIVQEMKKKQKKEDE